MSKIQNFPLKKYFKCKCYCKDEKTGFVMKKKNVANEQQQQQQQQQDIVRKLYF